MLQFLEVPFGIENMRREGDSNPRYLSVHSLSKTAPSTTRTSLQNKTSVRFENRSFQTVRILNYFSVKERREGDSNPRYLAVQRFSRPPESTALASLQNTFCYETKRVRTSGLQIRNLTLYPAEL